MRPLCIDLFAGCFGWGRGFVAEGYRVVGFDLVHEPYHGPVPEGCELVLQDVLTLSGAQFRNAACIVASPPCQCYSYMAMPWTRAKKMAVEYRDGTRSVDELNALFDACFRIQREASEAAGRHIPLVVENVKGAQPWVGRAKARFGSFCLWGDVEDVGGKIVASGRPVFGAEMVKASRTIKRPGRNFHAFENGLGSSPSFNGAGHETRGLKAVAQTRGLQNFDLDGPRISGAGVNRRAASAQIAKIPESLARHIARSFKP